MKPLIAVTLLLAACGGVAETPSETETSAIAIDAQPVAAIKRGANLFMVEASEPLTAIDADAWMPSMGHGSPTKPRVVQENNGKYRLEDVVFSMPGTWELRVHVTAEHGKGEKTFRYEVP